MSNGNYFSIRRNTLLHTAKKCAQATYLSYPGNTFTPSFITENLHAFVGLVMVVQNIYTVCTFLPFLYTPISFQLRKISNFIVFPYSEVLSMCTVLFRSLFCSSWSVELWPRMLSLGTYTELRCTKKSVNLSTAKK